MQEDVVVSSWSCGRIRLSHAAALGTVANNKKSNHDTTQLLVGWSRTNVLDSLFDEVIVVEELLFVVLEVPLLPWKRACGMAASRVAS